jgi:hypothetical protein
MLVEPSSQEQLRLMSDAFARVRRAVRSALGIADHVELTDAQIAHGVERLADVASQIPAAIPLSRDL